MGVSEELWLPKLRDLVKRQSSDREQRLAREEKLTAFLGEAVKEVDKLSTDPAMRADGANDEWPARQPDLQGGAEISFNPSPAYGEEMLKFREVAVADLCREASQIYQGASAENQSGLDALRRLRVGALGSSVERLEVMPDDFTHGIVLSAARNLKQDLGVSSGTAKSLLKLALQSAQASLLTTSRPF